MDSRGQPIVRVRFELLWKLVEVYGDDDFEEISLQIIANQISRTIHGTQPDLEMT